MEQNKEQEIKKEISFLKNRVDELSKELLTIKEAITNINDIFWDKQSKKESSSMYKVLQGEKPYTEIQSDVGKVRVDGELMEKMEKHLDNPALRGMVTTQEFLSYPKIAKNVKAEFNRLNKNYTWKVKSNDGNVLRYGSRKYVKDSENINRLLTTYSETEKGQRKINKTGVGGQSQSHHLINDFTFLHPADNIIPQSTNNNQSNNIKEKITDFFKIQKNPQNSNHNKER